MQVIKRNGQRQDVVFDKITERIKNLTLKSPPLINVNVILIAQKVVSGLTDGITTSQLDILAAETAIFMSTTHPDYATLASRLTISNLHKETPSSFEDVCDALYNHNTLYKGEMTHTPIISKHYYDIMKKYNTIIQANINYDYD